jgi:hypothetical protein
MSKRGLRVVAGTAVLTSTLGLGAITTASAVTRGELCAAYPTICQELPVTTKEEAPRCPELIARGIHDFEVNEPDPYGYDNYSSPGNGVGCETDGSPAPTPDESETSDEDETSDKDETSDESAEKTETAKADKKAEKDKTEVPTSIPAGL